MSTDDAESESEPENSPTAAPHPEEMKCYDRSHMTTPLLNGFRVV